MAFGFVHDGISFDQIIAFRQIVQDWMDELPKVYSRDSPDTQWDNDFWYVDWQRRNLQVTGYLTILHPLKAALVKDTKTSLSLGKLTSMAVNYSSLLISASESLLNLIFPSHASYHFAFFGMFEPAILLSLVVEDDDAGFPYLGVAIQSVESSLKILERLRHVSKSMTRLHTVLSNLATKLASISKGKARQLSHQSAIRPLNNQTWTSPPEPSRSSDAGSPSRLTPPLVAESPAQNCKGTRLNVDFSHIAHVSPQLQGYGDQVGIETADQFQDRATSALSVPLSPQFSLAESQKDYGVDSNEHQLVPVTTGRSFESVSNPLLSDSPKPDISSDI